MILIYFTIPDELKDSNTFKWNLGNMKALSYKKIIKNVKLQSDLAIHVLVYNFFFQDLSL